MESLPTYPFSITEIPSSIAESYASLQDQYRELAAAIHLFEQQPADQTVVLQFYKKDLPAGLQTLFYQELVLSSLLQSVDETIDKAGIATQIADRYKSIRQSEQEFILYMKCGMTAMDSYYFEPGRAMMDVIVPAVRFIPYRFAVPYYSQVYAKMITYDRLLYDLKQAQPAVSQPGLEWTGSQAELTELLYALNEMGVLNGKRNDIRRLKIAFEHLFGASLGNIYKTYENIRMRKKSRTPFLESLRNALIRRMEDDDLNAL